MTYSGDRGIHFEGYVFQHKTLFILYIFICAINFSKNHILVQNNFLSVVKLYVCTK